MSNAEPRPHDGPLDEHGNEVRVEPHLPEISGSDRLLLNAALAGPLAWCVQLGFDLPLVGWMCHHGTRWPMHVVTLAALLWTVWGMVVCSGRLHGEGAGADAAGADEREDAPPSVRRAVAVFGLGSGAFFLLLILASDVPGLILEACR